MNSSSNMTVSFYDDYGTLATYVKQDDTTREIVFSLVDNEILKDRANLTVYVRGKFSDGSIISPYEIPSEKITDETLTFEIPKRFAEYPGNAKCDLVFIKGAGEVDEITGEVINTDENSEILSTHNFNLYIEELPTNGGHLSPHQEDQMDALTRALEQVKELEELSEQIVVRAEAAADLADEAKNDAVDAKTDAESAAQRAEDAIDALGSLTFSIDSNGHLIWDYNVESPTGTGSLRFYESIKDLQDNKYDKTGGTISGNVTVTGNLGVDGNFSMDNVTVDNLTVAGNIVADGNVTVTGI